MLKKIESKSCEEYIETLTRDLPRLCTVGHLIKLGLYKSYSSAWYSRKTGKSPTFFKVPGRGILYPKAGIIKYFKRSANPRVEDDL